jgi:hypothetical protein
MEDWVQHAERGIGGSYSDKALRVRSHEARWRSYRSHRSHHSLRSQSFLEVSSRELEPIRA